MDTFAPGVAERIGCYVYLLIDPRDGTVFHVGQGVRQRCFAHLAEAHETPATAGDDNPVLARIRAIQEAGESVEISILCHGLCEQRARLVQSAAATLLALLATRQHGAEPSEFDAARLGSLSIAHLNTQYGAKPIMIDPAHRVALIRVEQLAERELSDDALYEATRKWWRVAVHRCVPGAQGAPEWALAVAGGIVRAVYRIESWRQATPEEVRADPGARKRWAFTGVRDDALEARYLYGDVTHYLRGQMPIRYVHCDGEHELAAAHALESPRRHEEQVTPSRRVPSKHAP